MAVQIIGAGVGRTGTHSLKVALERLVGGTCHHMVEVFEHPDELAVWQAAAEGSMPDWQAFLAGYSATCDWPSAAFWPELAAAFPDAPIVLSVREPDSWWNSVSNTIYMHISDSFTKAAGEDPWADMIRALFTNRFSTDLHDPDAMKQAFVAWNERLYADADPDRLVVWQPSDGWRPLCDALAVEVPDEAFPVTNTTSEFRERFGAPPL